MTDATPVTVAGAGAFGTALALLLARAGRRVTLWARDGDHVREMHETGENARHLPGVPLADPDGSAALTVTADPQALATAEAVLIAVPTQKLRGFLERHGDLIGGATCVLCCKGIETGTGRLPAQVLAACRPDARAAILTGPGFAAEIARGLPTAMTLAMEAPDPALQRLLSTPGLRLYLSDDPVGAQLGGALKNVIAIACGIATGAELGESARAALMTRGYAEILRLAADLGARRRTLSGLSGFGDLALTCTSPQSRNFALGQALGRGGGATPGTTYEGAATAQAALTLARARGIEMPIAAIVAAVLDGRMDIPGAIRALMDRPLKAEMPE